MDNLGKMNVPMMLAGLAAILVSVCVGYVVSPLAFFGVLGGVGLIFAAFPEKRRKMPELPDLPQTDFDPTSTTVGMS